jgi:hypothetical protein
MEPFKRSDFLRRIELAKNFSEYKKWIDSYDDYMIWINESERKLSKHFSIPITLKDI